MLDFYLHFKLHKYTTGSALKCLFFFPRPLPEFIDPIFAKRSSKRSFWIIQNQRFRLVFAKTGSTNSGTLWMNISWLVRSCRCPVIPCGYKCAKSCNYLAGLGISEPPCQPWRNRGGGRSGPSTRAGTSGPMMSLSSARSSWKRWAGRRERWDNTWGSLLWFRIRIDLALQDPHSYLESGSRS